MVAKCSDILHLASRLVTVFMCLRFGTGLALTKIQRTFLGQKRYRGNIGGNMKALLTVLTLTLMATVGASKAEAAQCKFELKNGRGKLLETFRGYGYSQREACRDARQQCRRVKKAGYYRAPIQVCEKVEQRRMVSASCTARMTGPRGHRNMGTFLGTALGYDYRDAERKACSEALQRCQTELRYNGRHGRSGRVHLQCVVDRGGVYAPTRPVPPRPVRPVRPGRRI